jgi:hypothetical protein
MSVLYRACCGIQPGAGQRCGVWHLLTSSGHQTLASPALQHLCAVEVGGVGAGLCASHSGQCMSAVVPVQCCGIQHWGWPTVWSVALATGSGHQTLASPALRHLCAVEVGGVGAGLCASHSGQCMSVVVPVHCCGIQPGAGQRVWSVALATSSGHQPSLAQPFSICVQVEVGGVGGWLCVPAILASA